MACFLKYAGGLSLFKGLWRNCSFWFKFYDFQCNVHSTPMKPHPWLVVALLTLAVFITDALTPPNLAVWLGYILPLLFAAKYLTKKQVYLFMAALSVLVISGGLFRLPAFSGVVAFNRTAGILTGWMIAILLVRQRSDQDSLRDMDEKFRTLVEESPVGNFLVQDWRFVYVNDRLARLFGYSKDELLALDSLVELAYPEDNQKAKEKFQDICSGSMSADFDIRGVRKDGMVVDVEMHLLDAAYGGRPATMGSVIDVSERKQMEGRQRDFVAMVTHDLKSPLTSVLGFSEIILGREDLDRDTRDMVEHIRNSAKRVLNMVSYFLTVSRMETGDLRLNLTPQDPADILHELKKSFSSIARKKGISLRVMFAPMKKIMMDRTYMERAVTNLLQNAFNYAGPDGTVSLSAYTGVRHADGRRKNRGFLAISVSDTGPGIAPDELDRIFEKYYQSGGKQENEERSKGSGLGLAVVKAVAEAHGGRAVVESSPGKGSTFRIFLPIREEV
jgi:PAS domain S-box-containing protein